MIRRTIPLHTWQFHSRTLLRTEKAHEYLLARDLFRLEFLEDQATKTYVVVTGYQSNYGEHD